MSPRRLIVHVLLVVVVVGLGGCQSTFPRACLKAEDCEHHPINGSSVNGPLVLGVEKSVR